MQFNNRSEAIRGSIIYVVIVSTFIIHLISAVLIAHQEWKYQKEHTPVYVIQLPPRASQNGNVSNRNDEANHNAVPTNTTRYNPILFQLENIKWLAIALGIFFIIQILQRFYTNYASAYLTLFVPELMTNVVIPIIFYARNEKARKFVLACFHCPWINIFWFVLCC